MPHREHGLPGRFRRRAGFTLPEIAIWAIVFALIGVVFTKLLWQTGKQHDLQAASAAIQLSFLKLSDDLAQDLGGSLDVAAGFNQLGSPTLTIVRREGQCLYDFNPAYGEVTRSWPNENRIYRFHAEKRLPTTMAITVEPSNKHKIVMLKLTFATKPPLTLDRRFDVRPTTAANGTFFPAATVP